MELLQLYDKNKNKKAGLTEYKDLCIESVLTTGDKKLSFSYPKNAKFYDEIVEEAYIRTKTQEYVIKARDVGVNYTKFDCVLNLEELEGNVFDRFESKEQTITNSLNLAIVGTGWTVKDNPLKKKRTVRCTNKSSLDIVKEIKKIYRVDIVFNTLKKQIEVYEHLGEDKGTYFIDSLNLTALQIQSDSYKFATRIIAEGKDGLTFADINGGKNYVENYQYSKKIKNIYWKDERYTVKESLLEDAKAKLKEISKPFRSYNASILNLAEINPKYKNILDYHLGDTITLISKNNKVKDKQRIVKTVEYPLDHSRDTVELANAILKFEDIQQENQETTDTVNNITTDNGTVDGSTVDSIQVKQIEDFKANVLEVTNLKAINANIENLHANKADIQDLHAVTAKIGTLEATKANITELTAVTAEISNLNAIKANITDLNAAIGKIDILETKTASIDNLLAEKATVKDLNALNANISNALIGKATIAQLEALETKTNNLIADKATIKDLSATNANINSLKADTADIKVLLNGNLSSENIQTGGITSDKLVISNGFIKDAMIDSLNVNKINSGVLNTDKINLMSKDGNLVIKDNTIQIKDSSKVRVQLGKDASGDYSLYVWDKNGKLMFNALGITEDAIKKKIIRNDMVSDNANIDGKKLNIESVVREVNDGKQHLKASKIDIDTKGQTLDIAFSELVTDNGKNKEEILALITKVSMQQGQINASIENSKILEGKHKTLEDNYNRTVATVDSLKNTIGSHKTLIDSATGKITSVEVKTNTLEKNLSGLKQSLTDTKKVIENNKTVLESRNAELKANIDKVSSSLSSVSNTVDKNNKTLTTKTNTLEQNLNGLIQTVSNNKTSLDGKISSVENKTHKLSAGLNGLTSKLDTLKSVTDGINKTVVNQGSVINQLKDSINLKVDSSTFTKTTATINNNINNIKIGGRNLAQLTEPKEYSSFTGKENDCQMPYVTLLNTLNVGDTITISFVFSYENLVPIQGRNDYFIRVQGSGDVVGWYDGAFPSLDISDRIQWGKGHSGSFKVVYNAPITSNSKKNTKWYSNFRMDCIKSGKVSVKEFMVEYGTKESAYTPAPEDLKKYSDEIAQAKAYLAQANAIANADNKATEALNNSKAYTNSQITTVNSHLNKATSEINILKGQISSKVSQSDIDKSIKNIEFGERNLILNSGYCKDLKYWDKVVGGGATSKDIFLDSGKNGEYTGPNLTNKTFPKGWCILCNTSLNCRKFKFTENEVYTIIGLIWTNNKGNVGFQIADGNSLNCVTSNTISINSWGYIPFKFTFTPKIQGNENHIRFSLSKEGQSIFIPYIKLIKGSMIGDWTPAPEDTNQLIVDNIKTVTDKISTVESNLIQKTNSIQAGVKDLNSTTQTITTNVSNINRDLSNKISSNLDAAKSFATDIAIAKANLAKEQAIASADGKITEEERKRIQQAQENLNTAIAKANEAESKAKSYADTKKQEAINSANNHADNKATEALNNAKVYTNSQITTVNSHLNKATSEINILKGQIESKVSQSDIDKSISAIQIGGRNLVLNSDVYLNNNGDIQFNFIDVNEWRNKYITVSLDIDLINVIGSRIGFEPSILYEDGTTQYLSIWEDVKSSKTKKGRISCTHKVADKPIKALSQRGIYIQEVTSGKVKIGRPKLEFGTKATDWTPAPEDIDVLVADNVKIINSKISNVSSNITQLKDSITADIRFINSKTQSIESTLNGKASKQEVSEVNNRVATVKTSLDGITQRVSATESKTHTLENNINGKASKQEVSNVSSKVVSLESNLNGITNRVSSTESRINTLDGKVKNATTKQEFTEFRQSTNNFILDIRKNGSVIKGNTITADRDKIKCLFEDGTYASMGRSGFEWFNAGTGHSYHSLAYVTSFGIPAGNPGRAYVKLPVEFTKRRKSLKWTIALRGYYYSTSGDFFPMHVHASGTQEYEENGILVCPVEGYCKIQNANNAGDIQFRPLTAMLIAVA